MVTEVLDGPSKVEGRTTTRPSVSQLVPSPPFIVLTFLDRVGVDGVRLSVRL